jgi:hypothetical protein
VVPQLGGGDQIPTCPISKFYKCVLLLFSYFIEFVCLFLFFSRGRVVDACALYYLIMRLALTLGQEFLFPFVPLSVTQETKNELGQQKAAFFSLENLWNNRMKR